MAQREQSSSSFSFHDRPSLARYYYQLLVDSVANFSLPNLLMLLFLAVQSVLSQLTAVLKLVVFFSDSPNVGDLKGLARFLTSESSANL